MRFTRSELRWHLSSGTEVEIQTRILLSKSGQGTKLSSQKKRFVLLWSECFKFSPFSSYVTIHEYASGVFLAFFHAMILRLDHKTFSKAKKGGVSGCLDCGKNTKEKKVLRQRDKQTKINWPPYFSLPKVPKIFACFYIFHHRSVYGIYP